MHMHVSNYNLEFTIDKSLYILNPLSGAFNRIDSKALTEQWKQLRDGNIVDINEEFMLKLKDGGFIYDSPDDEICHYNKVKNATHEYHMRMLRTHIIMSYNCNLDCVYCFEKNIIKDNKLMSMEMALHCLTTIKSLSINYKDVEVVLFGGEPLLYNDQQIKIIKTIIDFAASEGWTVDIITNGFELQKFVKLLENNKKTIGQIQITIDGPKKLHDVRKPHKDGKGSFDQIINSMDAALMCGLPCVVRVNIDNHNLDYLLELAYFFEQKKWFNQSNFGAYLGMTYDFEGDYGHQMYPHKLLKKFLELRLIYPILKNISLESWEPLQFLLYPYFKGEPRLPKFNFCSAQTGEYNFDLEGNIYFCADSVGRNECVAGRYAPRLEYFDVANQIRSNIVPGVDTNCLHCNVKLCCGGGCWFRRYLSKSTKCSEFVYNILHTAIKFLHYSPEVFSEKNL